MAVTQHINIGSIALYEDDGAGSYNYARLFKPQDYAVEDLTIHLRDNMGFGASMDIQDDRIIIGCPFEEPYNSLGVSVWNNRNIGAVYVFDKNNGDLLQKIVPDNTPATWTSGGLSGTFLREHNFGYSISAGSNFIVIGAPGYVDNNNRTPFNFSGRVYVYKWNTGTSQYDLVQTISPASKIANNRFGDSVHVDGNDVAITNSPKFGTANPGIVRYITLNDNLDGFTNDVKITNSHASWEYSIAIDNKRVAVGLPSVDTIIIYTIIDGIARQDFRITEDRLKSFEFGYDLEFDGDKLLVGCPNGYYKLGVVLRLGQASGTYTLV
jgi:hypothetical protein